MRSFNRISRAMSCLVVLGIVLVYSQQIFGAEISGKLVARVNDCFNPNHKGAHKTYMVLDTDTQQMTELDAANLDMSSLQFGKHVRVTGEFNSSVNVMAASDGAGPVFKAASIVYDAAAATSEPAAPTLQTLDCLLIFATTLDQPTYSSSRKQAVKDVLFNDAKSANKAIQAATYGKFTLAYSKDITVSLNTNAAGKSGGQMESLMTTEAVKTETFSNYDRIIFCCPDGTNSFTAYAYVGGSRSVYSYAWSGTTVDGYVHEIGHNFGFLHSARAGGPPSNEYQDQSCVMGYSHLGSESSPRQDSATYGAVKKIQMGCTATYPGSEVTLTGDATYDLYPVAINPDDEPGMRIVRLNGTDYYISYLRNLPAIYGKLWKSDDVDRVILQTNTSFNTYSVRQAAINSGTYDANGIDVIFERFGPSNSFATVSFDFPDGNTKPVANAQSVVTGKNVSKVITLTGSDVNGTDILTFAAVSDPANGTLSGTGAVVTYTPNSNYVGTDSFVFKVNDGNISSFATVSITINEAAPDALTLTISAASVSEGDGLAAATATVSRNSDTTNSLLVTLSSSDTTEAKVPTTVTIAANQTVSPAFDIEAVDDQIVDGTKTVTIIGTATGHSNGADNLQVTDDDTAGITVSAISGDTAEIGTAATFTVVLGSEPTDDVTIGIFSSDTTEGTVDKSSLTFTSGNWDTPQTVTVAGQDDALDDGDIDYTIFTDPASSSDLVYNTLNPDNVSVTNLDNDTAGITVSTISGDTAESGTTATFTVVLTSEPTADVTFGIFSSDGTEGSVDKSSLTFTNGNWETPQTVTVTGKDDFIDDGDITYDILTNAATSSDGKYNGTNPDNVSVTNLDDDTAGITVSTISRDTAEDGTDATFTVVLAAEPAADVTIGISSDNTNEGTVDKSSLVFTSANWLTPQTVTVTGVDDVIDDGDITYNVVTAAATSSDLSYNGLDPADVSVINQDDDGPGFLVTTISGDTAEVGTPATFTVVLTSLPTASVTVGITSGDTTEGSVDKASLIFTTGDWFTPQTVTVTGLNDDIDDGDITYSIVTAPATSGDGNYSGLNPNDVSVTNTDDDTKGITVSAISGDTSEDGTQATFTVVLTSEPIANVAIGITSSDLTEGTVDKASLTFAAGDWNQAQTVTVTGINDADDDGDITFDIVTAAATSSDSNYNGVDPADVSVTNLDNDGPPAVTLSLDTATIPEASGVATLTATLAAKSASTVTIVLGLSGVATGADYSISSPSISIGAGETVGSVTITATQDNVFEGDEDVIVDIASVTNATTDGLQQQVVIIQDDDTAPLVTLSTSSNFVAEASGLVTVTAELSATSSEDVTVQLAFTGQATPAVDYTASAGSIVVLAGNTTGTATLTAVPDTVFEGDETIIVDIDSVSSNAVEGAPSQVTVTILEDDTAPRVSLAVDVAGIAENGGIATFTATLSATTTLPVTVDLLFSGTAVAGDYTASSSQILINAGSLTGSMTVTGVDDVFTEPSETVIVDIDTVTNALEYNVQTAQTAIIDDDGSSVTLTIDKTTMSEAGGVATVTASLSALSTVDVSVTLAFSGTARGPGVGIEYDYSATNMIIIPANNPSASIDITAINDVLNEVDETVIVDIESVGNSKEDGQQTVTVTIEDDGDPVPVYVTLSVSPGSISEKGGTATLTAQLSSATSNTVSVVLATSGSAAGAGVDYTLSQTQIDITAGNTSGTAVLTAVDNTTEDTSRVIVTDIASVANALEQGTQQVQVTITDDESTGGTGGGGGGGGGGSSGCNVGANSLSSLLPILMLLSVAVLSRRKRKSTV